MIIDRRLETYIVSEDVSIQETAAKITRVRGRIVFCVDGSGRLVGSVSNGDLIRWIAAAPAPDAGERVGAIANRGVRVGRPTDSAERINELLSDVLYLPLVDDERRLTGVARRREPSDAVEIANRRISIDDPTFVIAEIGNNHNGNVERAFELIRLAARAGADCAKFQMRDMTALYGKSAAASAGENLGTEYVLDLLGRFQLGRDDLFRCFDLARSLGLVPLCTAWDDTSAEELRHYGLPALKVASADLTNHTLLKTIAGYGIPLICSTGMSSEEEITETARLLQKIGASFIFLHCNSTYPAPFKDINLRYLKRLAEIAQGVVGYSGHERDIAIAIAAVAMDARVIEKHFTVDRALEGNDHKVSLLPDEFAMMVRGIRQVEEGLGSGRSRNVSQGERANRVALGKSIFAKADIDAGTILVESLIEVRGPGEGLQPNKLAALLGRPVPRLVRAGTPFYPSDLESVSVRVDGPRRYSFGRPWGIPVRYRDLEALLGASEPDFVEFHLSYRDLDGDASAAVIGRKRQRLVVHAPELFRGDHVLDLCSLDQEYRAHSLKELARVVETVKRLSEHFAVDGPVGIVTNVGGFSLDRPLGENESKARISILKQSLEQAADPAVVFWPQTMPPFPWHFGGQRFHNLFVSATEIVALCTALGLRVCLDTSHSMLACTHRGESFMSFLESVSPFAAHLHIADARGVDGEGLQIGEGAIDFGAMFQVIDRAAPGAGFIPEIWQGHENTGEGFWLALDRLAKARKATPPSGAHGSR